MRLCIIKTRGESRGRVARTLSLRGVVLAAFALLALSGCSRELEAFAFSVRSTPPGSSSAAAPGAAGTASGVAPAPGAESTTALIVPRSVPAESEAGLLPGTKPPLDSPKYQLKPAVTINGADRAFFLSYRTPVGPLSLGLTVRQPTANSAEEIHIPLPAGKIPAVTLLVPLADGTAVLGFQVVGSAADAAIAITGAGVSPDYRGVQFAPDGGLLIEQGAGLREEQNAGVTIYTVSLPAPTQGAEAHAGTADAARIEYRYDGGGGATTISVADAAGSSATTYTLHPIRGSHSIFIYPADCGCTPRQVVVQTANRGISLLGVSDALTSTTAQPPAAAPSASSETPVPLPADFGAIISYDPADWRQNDFELYRWSLVPSVLVMDFRTLEVQSRFFKRLAFYVEKAGHAGTIMTNSEMAPLHGWNAHDYRPEDLARFFNTAAAKQITLNPEEYLLEKILIRNGVLKQETNGTLAAGQGAVLSFSHDGTYWLRYLLLTHEGYHGIYFTHADYRAAIAKIWDSIPLKEQEFWRLFLGAREYNSDDDYLVVNEFEAYLMQQPLADVQQYYLGEIRSTLERLPQWKSLGLGQFVNDNPKMFLDAARKVQDAVSSAAGVDAGSLVEITPAP